jgi:hypothetical protein
MRPQNDSCLPFCSGLYGSVVGCTILSLDMPRSVSAEVMALPFAFVAQRCTLTPCQVAILTISGEPRRTYTAERSSMNGSGKGFGS